MKRQSYLITYYATGNFDNNVLLNHIKVFPTWAMITENTWIIQTPQSALYIRDFFRPLLPTASRILVIKIEQDAAWANLICPNNWLNDNLTL